MTQARGTGAEVAVSSAGLPGWLGPVADAAGEAAGEAAGVLTGKLKHLLERMARG